MGNSVSCFERVSEHPPYSWPKDHPDRERAIAERKRARHNMRLAEKQARGRTDAQQVQPEAAAAAQPKPDSKEVAETNAPEKPVEEPKVAEVTEKETADEIVKKDDTVDANASAVEEKVEELQKDATVGEAAEQIAAEEVAADLKPEDAEKVPDAGAEAVIEEVSKALEDENPAAEKMEAAEVDAAVVDEVTPIEDTDKIEGEEKEIVDELVEEKEAEIEAEIEAVTPVHVEDEEPQEKAPETKPVEEQNEIVPVEEPTKEEPKEEEAVAVEEKPEEPPTEAADVPTTPKSPEGVVKEVKPDIADEELPSIQSRRAMFDTAEDELPKPSDTNRDVYDAVCNEYITLEEYRKRQRERAQGLVKERLEKFEEIDEEVSKEKAELAAIVAARNEAQLNADWTYKQQMENAKTPIKETDSAIKEVQSPETPLSPSTGSVAGISAKFEADGVDVPPGEDIVPVLSETKLGSEVGVVDAVNTPVEPKAITETVEDVIASKPDITSEVTEKVETVEGATTETPDIREELKKAPEKVSDVKKSAEATETEGNTIQVPQVAES